MVLERVQKIIAESGSCSRRDAEELISEGRVTVNGVKISLGDKADSKVDTILVDDSEIYIPDKEYYMLHKPKDYISTVNDTDSRNKVVDLVNTPTRIFPVGRLDRDATGLILLTNDGEFSNEVAHPKSQVQKTYIAILKDRFDPKDAKKLLSGVKIDYRIVKADQVVVLDRDTVAISLHVGLHKVVKRIFKQLGYYVKHLHRTHIGSLPLDIPVGEYRELTSKDKKLLFRPLQLSKQTFK